MYGRDFRGAPVDLLAAHLYGLARPGEVRHLCPDCGGRGRIADTDLVCPWCEGHADGVTTAQLARWQAAQGV